MNLRLTLNGQEREFDGLSAGVALSKVLEALGLRADRIAVEVNGEIVPRTEWAEAHVQDRDRVEVVHFVGGGSTQ